jgi:hypothetical protein
VANIKKYVAKDKVTNGIIIETLSGRKVLVVSKDEDIKNVDIKVDDIVIDSDLLKLYNKSEEIKGRKKK